jgi:DNA helicase-2/ATP-dependent DNA helicase PcrA
MELTRSQRAAIEHRGGHLQLIACAGSGKTEVVARRIARMLDPREDDALAPRSVIAFTFTDRAADELEARIHRRVRDSVGTLRGMAELYIGTIHAFCRQFLQDEVAEFLRCSTLDAVGQRMLVAREPERSGFSIAQTLEGAPLSLEKDVGLYLGAIDVLRQGEVDRTRLGSSTLGEALERYRALLRDESLLDYSGQLELALDVIRRDIEAGQRLAARVRHIVVDEYQDTNPLQERVIRALVEVTGATLTVVGDDDQTIYGFNGADIDNILTFANRYQSTAPVTTVRLEENFRSSQPIVEFARGFVERIERRLPKAMIATVAQPSATGDLATGLFRGRFDEARAIARKILALRESAFTEGGVTRGLSWSDFAVLVRSGLHYNVSELVKVFDEQGIPYVVAGRKGLLQQPECLALRTLFAALAGAPGAADALYERWRSSELTQSLAPIDALVRWVAEARTREDPALTMQGLLLEALDVARVRERGEDDLRFANAGRFSALLSQFERLWARRSLAERLEGFVSYCDRSEREHDEASGVSELRAPDAVRVSTVHAAKGLQWPVVFLPRVEEGQFPLSGREAKQWSVVAREVVRSPERYDQGEDDERRLFYVAATRAQRYLFVSAAGAKGNAARPSPYFRAFDTHAGVTRTLERALRPGPHTPSRPREGTTDQRLTFSELKPLFDCAYRYKLQSSYRFCAPHHVAEGFGKSLHDALAEVHRRALDGDVVDESLVPALTTRHLHLPFADESLTARSREAMQRILDGYLRTHHAALSEVELVEKPIRLHFDDGISVEGRIDLVVRRASAEVSVVDMKSDRSAQSEALSEAQLRLYALGYEELTGARPANVEVWELDVLREKVSPVSDEALESVRALVTRAAAMLREATLAPSPDPRRCAACPARPVCAHRDESEPSH